MTVTLFSQACPPGFQGLYMGFYSGGGRIGQIFGPVFTGFVFHHYGSDVTFGISAAILGISIFIVVFQRGILFGDGSKEEDDEMDGDSGYLPPSLDDWKPRDGSSFSRERTQSEGGEEDLMASWAQGAMFANPAYMSMMNTVDFKRMEFQKKYVASPMTTQRAYRTMGL
eukprot:TRINITY_DN2286_c0_g1_i1.p3 TRINITY_DN2286_c0_g1~~TRINITY_DN2286_c0_g1_i1.p3  ORF type:complete len:169 (-),score=44.13 TRINITY_DN2286_c0_g1_i1:563-1069(-)